MKTPVINDTQIEFAYFRAFFATKCIFAHIFCKKNFSDRVDSLDGKFNIYTKFKTKTR